MGMACKWLRTCATEISGKDISNCINKDKRNKNKNKRNRTVFRIKKLLKSSSNRKEVPMANWRILSYKNISHIVRHRKNFQTQI